MVEEFGKLKYIQLFKNADDTSAGMCLIEFVDTNVQVEALQKMRLQYNIILAEDALTKRIIDRNLLRLQMRNQSELMKTQIPTRCIIIRNLVTTASVSSVQFMIVYIYIDFCENLNCFDNIVAK